MKMLSLGAQVGWRRHPQIHRLRCRLPLEGLMMQEGRVLAQMSAHRWDKSGRSLAPFAHTLGR